MKTSDLVKIAKKEKKNVAVKKIVSKTIEEKPKIIEEDRDTKAKKTVEKLLEGISFNPDDYNKKVDDSKIIDNSEIDGDEGEFDNTNINNNEWLEQQVNELTIENELLRNQIASNKENKNYNNSDILLEENNVKTNVVNLFMELQNVYINVGFNYTTGVPRTNMIINPEQFMVRLLDFFPFLEDYRKIQLH